MLPPPSKANALRPVPIWGFARLLFSGATPAVVLASLAAFAAVSSATTILPPHMNEKPEDT